MTRRLRVLGTFFALGALVACLSPSPSSGRRAAVRALTKIAAPAPRPLALSVAPPPPPVRPADRVIIVSIDGLRPDALGWRARTLRHLAREGTTAREAQTIRSSSTLPSHAAMLSGVDVDEHGLDFNAYRPANGRIRVPSVFSLARARGLSTSLVVGKRKLEHIVREGDAELFRTGGIFCHRVNRIAVPHLREAREGVHFVHYSDVDAAGHRHGWMSPRYHRAVRRVDRCLGEIVDTLRARGDLDRTLLLVTADHGGHGRSHGSARRSDMRIPWIAWGGAARSGARVGRVDTRDTAATVIEALDLHRPAGIDGRPVLAALAGPR